ncbi:MAG: zinc-ribbon domain containing protein [Armatimonadota bacterium]|nr:MAG: zinc-ribbon domain containing protein [Armatimonadota bacterium]
MDERAEKRGTCKECKRAFVFTPAEREAFAAQGRYHIPSRCPECREARAQARAEGAAKRPRHPIVCAKCGARTLVPFVPRTQKPVYCRACFLEMRDGAMSSSGSR